MNNLEYMKEAIRLAKLGEACGEVPVGALVVLDNKIIGRGYNKPISSNSVSAHAEIIALEEACKSVGNYRLPNAKLYVTLEPCSMCAGAILHARLSEVYFGAYDSKSGACGSVLDIINHPKLNHKLKAAGGLLEETCVNLLKEFFKKRR